jgi:DNA repair photolyase
MFYYPAMAKTSYTELGCKAALNRVHGMPIQWSLNPCRGCVHGCDYCYARASHTYYGLNADDDFERRIFVKTNMVEVLRRELGRPSWKGEQVAIGTATDPYQPCEGRYRLTSGILEVLRDRCNPLSIVTKSTLLVRDIDLLAEIAAVASVQVFVTVTTLDRGLWRAIEPGTPPPHQRLRVVRQLTEAGIPAGVLMAPVFPGITDTPASIEAVVSAAAEHGAKSCGTSMLRLAPFVKEHYLDFVKETFPDLIDRYERAYIGTHAPADYIRSLERRIVRIRSRHGFEDDPMSKSRPLMLVSLSAPHSMRSWSIETSTARQLEAVPAQRVVINSQSYVQRETARLTRLAVSRCRP